MYLTLVIEHQVLELLSVMDYLFISFALLFISFSQILQKLAAVNAGRQQSGSHFLRRLVAQKETWWALISLMIGTLFWLAVLSRMEVSKAFPFLSLGFVIVLLASRYHFHEMVSTTRWIGVAAIIAGIVLLSQA